MIQDLAYLAERTNGQVAIFVRPADGGWIANLMVSPDGPLAEDRIFGGEAQSAASALGNALNCAKRAYE